MPPPPQAPPLNPERAILIQRVPHRARKGGKNNYYNKAITHLTKYLKHQCSNFPSNSYSAFCSISDREGKTGANRFDDENKRGNT